MIYRYNRILLSHKKNEIMPFVATWMHLKCAFSPPRSLLWVLAPCLSDGVREILASDPPCGCRGREARQGAGGVCVGGGGDGGTQQLSWSRSGFPAESWPLELRRRGQAFWRERERGGEREEALSLSLSHTHTHTPSQQREALFPHKVEKPQEHRKGSCVSPALRCHFSPRSLSSLHFHQAALPAPSNPDPALG